MCVLHIQGCMETEMNLNFVKGRGVGSQDVVTLDHLFAAFYSRVCNRNCLSFLFYFCFVLFYFETPFSVNELISSALASRSLTFLRSCLASLSDVQTYKKNNSLPSQVAVFIVLIIAINNEQINLESFSYIRSCAVVRVCNDKVFIYF